MPLLTLFTAPKPFLPGHIDLIQRNALSSWKALGEQVQIVLIGGEAGIAEAANEYGFTHLPDVKTNALGTPLISSIFALAREVNDSPYLAYVNADIILFPEIISISDAIGRQQKQFLMVGQRWDWEVREALKFEAEWVKPLRERVWRDGKLHSRTGSDYFVFPRTCYQDIPDFTVGRAGWDNWMIYQARKQVWPVIDCTSDLDIIHQNHDYSHLPDGQRHYRLPETDENVRLAGGKRTIFELDDATHRFVKGRLEPMPNSRRRFWRELQNKPMLKHNNYALTQLIFSVLHPKKAWKEFQRNREIKAQLAKTQKGEQ